MARAGTGLKPERCEGLPKPDRPGPGRVLGPGRPPGHDDWSGSVHEQIVRVERREPGQDRDLLGHARPRTVGIVGKRSGRGVEDQPVVRIRGGGARGQDTGGRRSQVQRRIDALLQGDPVDPRLEVSDQIRVRSAESGVEDARLRLAAPAQQLVLDAGDPSARGRRPTSAPTGPGDADPEGGAEYPSGPCVAVGAVVVRDGAVLLVRRGKPPSEGVWAIPGGRIRLGETLAEARVRPGEARICFDGG